MTPPRDVHRQDGNSSPYYCDAKTGKELWAAKIDAGAHASPVTYQGKDGKQYIVIAETGGSQLFDPTKIDALIAFALL